MALDDHGTHFWDERIEKSMDYCPRFFLRLQALSVNPNYQCTFRRAYLANIIQTCHVGFHVDFPPTCRFRKVTEKRIVYLIAQDTKGMFAVTTLGYGS